MTKLLEALKSKLKHWQSSPLDFVLEVIGVSPTEHQAQLLKALPHSRKFAIRSGHGTGKSAVLSWTLIWFLLCFPNSKVLCTAPSRRQLFDILWAEVSLWLHRARLKELTSILQVQSETIRVGSRKDWFARAAAVSVQQSPEEQAEILAGYHADHICVIVDEASGVPDPVFKPLETYSTNDSAKIILAGNPTRNEGYFFEVFHSQDTSWTLFHWSSEDSPLVSDQWLSEMKARYGEDSPDYLIRVKGEFPPSHTEVLIPESWLRRSVYEGPPSIPDSLPAIWGVDVAHHGSSETAIVSRRGPYVDLAKTRFGLDSVQIVDWILEELSHYTYPVKAICIDCSGGWGVGVADTLRRILGPKVISVNFGWASAQEEFLYLKDELWFTLRTHFEHGTLFIPPNEKLIRQLSSVRASSDPSGRRFRVEQKKSLRSRNIPSPDLGDALALTYYLDPPASAFTPYEASLPVRRTRYASSWRVV